MYIPEDIAVVRDRLDAHAAMLLEELHVRAIWLDGGVAECDSWLGAIVLAFCCN